MIATQHLNTNGDVETMREDQALSAFAALSQEHRLRILRPLVKAGPEGMPVGRADARHGGDEGGLVKKVVALAVKREAVAHLKALFGQSERQACQIAGADRKMVRYQSQSAPDIWTTCQTVLAARIWGTRRRIALIPGKSSFGANGLIR
jgi:hypothetical protein